jgi:hypothetical protein
MNEPMAQIALDSDLHGSHSAAAVQPQIERFDIVE